jgi:hypothetical protein
MHWSLSGFGASATPRPMPQESELIYDLQIANLAAWIG